MIRKDIRTIEFNKIGLGYEDLFFDGEIELGSIIWIRGDEGIGKSSFLKMIAGLLSPSAGEFLLNKSSVYKMSFEEFLPYRLNIGFGFETGALLNNKTIFDNLLLPLEYHSEIARAESKARVESYLKWFDIFEFSKRRPAHVSSAVRKITGILRAHIMHPQIVLLDDVTTGLSEKHLSKLKAWIVNYKSKNPKSTTFITTQDSSFMSDVCDGELWLTRQAAA